MTSGSAGSIPPFRSRIGSAVRSISRPLRLSALEIASGVVLGSEVNGLMDVSSPQNPKSPLGALEEAVLPALLRAPCLVSFSGGMDSSIVLAVATRTARRHGLADPIPVTWRFTNAPKAEESQWQRKVLDDLQIGERLVLQANDDLDFIGPIATPLLCRYGVLFPANLYVHQPLFDQAVGGSMLTGVGGDQVLNSWSRTVQVGRRRTRDRLPYGLRLRVQQHRGHAPYPWLRRDVARDLLRRRHYELHNRPSYGLARVHWKVFSRDLLMTCQNLNMLGRESGVQVIHPLLNSGFHTALDAFLGACDVNRAELLAAVVGDELPRSTHEYRPKALFGQVFMRRNTREFQASWDGSGVVDSLVDPVALRAVWSPESSNTTTAMLLQQVWLNHLRPAHH